MLIMTMMMMKLRSYQFMALINADLLAQALGGFGSKILRPDALPDFPSVP